MAGGLVGAAEGAGAGGEVAAAGEVDRFAALEGVGLGFVVVVGGGWWWRSGARR